MVLSQVRPFIQKREKVMINITLQYDNVHLNNQIIQLYEECICYTNLIHIQNTSQ